MGVDRGVLARIDRKLLAGLGQDETYRMVRIPVTEAKWLTWKRYCDLAGISMGRALVALIDRELGSAFRDSAGEDSAVLARRARKRLAGREAEVACREQAVTVAEERLRDRSDHLRLWESELAARERRVEVALKLAVQRREAVPKVGRNERCPCGSGLKYKHCHGLAGRPPKAVPT